MTEQERFMKEAIRQAKKAEALEEVPIGCVIVHEGKIIARGYNRRNTDKNTLSHAELNAIRKASKKLVYNLFKLLKTKQVYDLIDGDVDDAFVTYFLNHYAEDIKAYFPGFRKQDIYGKKTYIVCCDGNPAGVLVGGEKEGNIDILIDYSTPAYRDCSIGKFLYSQLSEKKINRLSYAQELTDIHLAYMNKMGFVQEKDVYVKKIN